MKNLYTFILVLFSLNTFAQEMVINPRVRAIESPSAGNKEATAIITNNAVSPNDTLFEWKIIDYNLAAGWDFTFCDNKDCYANLNLNSTRQFILKKGASGPLKGDFIFNSTGGNGDVKVVVASLSNNTMIDTFTMLAKGWSVGLNKVIRNAADVTVYPSPARNEVTFKYPVNKPVDVTIYNVLGSKVKTFTHSGNETQIDISGLQKGMYFMRFTVGDNVISKSFTKAE